MNGKKSFSSPFTLLDKPVILVTVQTQAWRFQHKISSDGVPLHAKNRFRPVSPPLSN
jgi:hypothetical protein